MLDLYANVADLTFPASRWLILVLSVVDIVWTQQMIRLAGVNIETNPVYRWAWARAGKLGLWSVWLPLIATVLWVVDTPSSALFVCGLLMFILINNLFAVWCFNGDESQQHERSVIAHRGMLAAKIGVVCFATIAVMHAFHR